MKFTLIAFLSLAGSIAALPASPLEARTDPSLAPITLDNGPSQTDTLTCKWDSYTSSYSGKDVWEAVQYAIALKENGETRGKASYPHAIDKNDSKGHTLTFPSSCPADKSRYEYPLKQNGYYNGGKKNKNTSDERVVFYYEDGEIDNEGHPKAYYCGLITHGGKKNGAFRNC